jgi:hypothetical protein
MGDDSKIACFRCLARKERIDEIERYFLMWEENLKLLIKNVTELKGMKDELSLKIATFKDDFDQDYLKCT